MSIIIKMDSIKSAGHLKQAIAYILNEDKTEGLSYSNAGQTADEIYDNFQFTKSMYRNRGIREGYHFKLSFSKDETISYEDALEFAKEWAACYLQTQEQDASQTFLQNTHPKTGNTSPPSRRSLDAPFDFVTAVHTDRDHTHMHLIFNSVSRHGRKYRYEKGHTEILPDGTKKHIESDWDRIIRPLTNHLAEKYHTGPLREKDPHLDYTPAKNWIDVVCSDIDACIDMVFTENSHKQKSDTESTTQRDSTKHEHAEPETTHDLYEEFKRRLQSDFGYTLREGISRDHGIYLSLTPPGKAKAIRTYRLPPGYQVNDINNRLGGYETITPDDLTEYKHSYDVKNDWFNCRSIFIPYDQLSFYQKHFVRQMLTARRLYHGTNASMSLREQSSVAYEAIRGHVRLVCHYHVTSDEALERAIHTLTERCNLRRATKNDKSALNELRRIQVTRLEQLSKNVPTHPTTQEEYHAERNYR